MSELGRFDDEFSAFCCYKKEKECFIKHKAEEYFNLGLITEAVFNALCNYTVDISD